jgi:hypothetical protein
MSRAEPLITPEELQCLLGGASARSGMSGRSLLTYTQVWPWGLALWLVKGIFLYAVLMSPEAGPLLDGGRYLWMRGSLELACLSVFWFAAVQPRGRPVASASLLIASTTLLMDAMTLLAFGG